MVCIQFGDSGILRLPQIQGESRASFGMAGCNPKLDSTFLDGLQRLTKNNSSLCGCLFWDTLAKGLVADL